MYCDFDENAKRVEVDTYFAKNVKIYNFRRYNRLILYTLKKYIATS